MGSRWVAVDSVEHEVVRVDTATINKTQQGTYLAWIEVRFSQVKRVDKTEYTRNMMRQEFDCGSRKMRIIEMHLLCGKAVAG